MQTKNDLMRVLGKWWFRRMTVGLLGDDNYIADPEERQKQLEVYLSMKQAGEIRPLTPEEHRAGYAAWRK